MFFERLVKTYKHNEFESDDEEGFYEGLYVISLQDEAYEGSKIIAKIMIDLGNISSEVYKDKSSKY